MNPEDIDIVPTPIEEVDTGSSLAIKHEGHAVLFQVENKKFAYTPDKGAIWTLESEPLEDGKPLVIQGPSGTICHRIVRRK
jgi:hypothetical protein